MPRGSSPVMILTINCKDLDILISKGFRTFHSGESSSRNDNFRLSHDVATSTERSNKTLPRVYAPLSAFVTRPFQIELIRL